MTTHPSALESSAAPRRVRRVSGYRKNHAPPALTTLDPRNLGPAVLAVQNSVRYHQRAGFATFLFIDKELRVYAMSEMQSMVSTWLRERCDWLVGVYATRRRDGRLRNPDGSAYSCATTTGLTDDITAHLGDLGVAQ